MGFSFALIAAIIMVLIIVAGLVAIAALIINAVVKVKMAKYNSLQGRGQNPDAGVERQEEVWPPPPRSPG